MAAPVVWVGYTTQYRDGGPMLERAARTLAAGIRDASVVCVAVESKQAFKDEMARLAARGQKLSQLHLVTHAGMYGPMFGSVAWPEQMSPHEWRTQTIPFANDGQAFFHSCRSARWFARFFARTFRVPSHGYTWYTAFSTRPDVFRWAHPLTRSDAPIYVFGCPGRKSHGLLGSAGKYLGAVEPEKFQVFQPPEGPIDSTYDPVAKLYNEAYADIRVRHDEWTWLSQRITQGARVVDLGCGNGSLLSALAPRISSGVGVDLSERMLAYAKKNNSEHEHIDFRQVEGPSLPISDDQADLVISMLSFRYLDWDPIMEEIRRVLAPGGRLVIIDMVAVPPTLRELPKVLWQKLGVRFRVGQYPRFRHRLNSLVTDPRWKDMLSYNPIRSEHEMRWYLSSRFPESSMEVLNIGMNSRVLAFDSGPIRK